MRWDRVLTTDPGRRKAVGNNSRPSQRIPFSLWRSVLLRSRCSHRCGSRCCGPSRTTQPQFPRSSPRRDQQLMTSTMSLSRGQDDLSAGSEPAINSVRARTLGFRRGFGAALLAAMRESRERQAAREIQYHRQLIEEARAYRLNRPAPRPQSGGTMVKIAIVTDHYRVRCAPYHWWHHAGTFCSSARRDWNGRAFTRLMRCSTRLPKIQSTHTCLASGDAPHFLTTPLQNRRTGGVFCPKLGRIRIRRRCDGCTSVST